MREMREYVVGYYNKVATKDDFVILATTDSKNVARYITYFYNEDCKAAGLSAKIVLLASCEVPKNYRFAE